MLVELGFGPTRMGDDCRFEVSWCGAIQAGLHTVLDTQNWWVGSWIEE